MHEGTGKSNTTVLLTISADGTCLPPYIIYKSLRLYDQWCPKNVIPGAVFNGTESGWVDESCFFDYLSKLFIPKTYHLPRPLLLILDNHSTHLSIKTAKLAIQHDIHILCFPSHGTHILQPLDIYTFKYVKTQWRNLLWEYNKSSHNKSLDKADFVKLFAKLYNYSLLPAHCAPAFAKAGIYPYDSRIIRREKLINSGADTLTITANTNSLHRSLSVEFDEPSQPDCLTSTTSTTIKRNKLVRSLSAPILLSGNFSLVTTSSKKSIFLFFYFLLENIFNFNHDDKPSSRFDTSSSLHQHVTTTSDETTTAIHQLNNEIQEIAQISTESLDFNTSIAISNSTDISLASSSNAQVVTASLSNSMNKGKVKFFFNKNYFNFSIERDSLSAIQKNSRKILFSNKKKLLLKNGFYLENLELV